MRPPLSTLLDMTKGAPSLGSLLQETGTFLSPQWLKLPIRGLSGRGRSLNQHLQMHDCPSQVEEIKHDPHLLRPDLGRGDSLTKPRCPGGSELRTLLQ